ncbi:copper chaperone PCu(A)C [Calidithermus chliarophilus]|uniref:copper chaperone PCu(A)C n=1 Tax=Calidithermus chliarophilus TaxID=52023 RepID=UPI00041CDFBC|nr:copper chaperone PCu(A)C [Calidithermus chliarophilus]
MKVLRLLPHTLFLLGLLVLAQNSLTAQNAWVRLLPTPNLAAYLTFSNPTDKPVRLLGVSTPVALKAEFHETKTLPASDHNAHGQTTTMVPLKDVVVPAKGKLEFKPGGKHIMLLGVKRTLKEGEKVPLVFRLEGGKSITVQAVVKAQ